MDSSGGTGGIKGFFQSIWSGFSGKSKSSGKPSSPASAKAQTVAPEVIAKSRPPAEVPSASRSAPFKAAPSRNKGFFSKVAAFFRPAPPKVKPYDATQIQSYKDADKYLKEATKKFRKTQSIFDNRPSTEGTARLNKVFDELTIVDELTKERADTVVQYAEVLMGKTKNPVDTDAPYFKEFLADSVYLDAQLRHGALDKKTYNAMCEEVLQKAVEGCAQDAATWRAEFSPIEGERVRALPSTEGVSDRTIQQCMKEIEDTTGEPVDRNSQYFKDFLEAFVDLDTQVRSRKIDYGTFSERYKMILQQAVERSMWEV